MKLTKKAFSIVLCLVLAMSFVVAVPASARTYAVIEFEGLDLPVPDKTPDFEINSLCEDYDVMNFAGNNMIIWIEEDEGFEMGYNDTFVDGRDYRVKIYLEPTSNQVEIVEGAKFMMDNSGLDWYIYQDSNGIYAQKYFDTCGEIKNACVYIDEPVVGAKPDFSLTHDNRFVAEGNVNPTKNGVSWYDITDDKYLISGTNDVFKAGHEYKVVFNLRSYESKFVEGGKITVNRYSGVVEILAESFANVEYTFAQLEGPSHTCAPEFVAPEPPKCDKEGHIGYYLCECGKIYWDDQATDEALEPDLSIPATGHSEVIVPGKDATCTEKGLTEGKKCEICGVVTVEQKEIATIGHKEIIVPGKDATCTETGLTEGKKCEVCGTVTVEQTVIDKTIHGAIKIPEKAPTYFDKGLTEGLKCVFCGVVLSKQKTVAKLTLAKVTGLKAKTSKKGQATVTYKRVAGATGYIIEYSTKKNFAKKSTKQLVIKKGKTLKATLKKLAKGKTYYIRVKAFVKANGKEAFAKYSAKVSIKVK